MGLHLPDPEVPDAPPEVIAAAEKRQMARESQDWEGADILREEIKNQGWTVKDGQDGYELKPL